MDRPCRAVGQGKRGLLRFGALEDLPQPVIAGLPASCRKHAFGMTGADLCRRAKGVLPARCTKVQQAAQIPVPRPLTGRASHRDVPGGMEILPDRSLPPDECGLGVKPIVMSETCFQHDADRSRADLKSEMSDSDATKALAVIGPTTSHRVALRSRPMAHEWFAGAALLHRQMHPFECPRSSR